MYMYIIYVLNTYSMYTNIVDAAKGKKMKEKNKTKIKIKKKQQS